MSALVALALVLACKDEAPAWQDTAPELDPDGDGYAAPADCDEGDSTVYPSAPELCDGVDNDCDGEIDTDADTLALSFGDADGDGHGDPFAPIYTCEPPAGSAQSSDDCDDTDDTVYPGAEEWCDGVDDDCDGVADDEALDTQLWLRDDDGDGYGDPLITRATAACEMPPGYADNPDDCDDARADVHPGADEVCDEADTDEDCDGEAEGGDATGQSAWHPDLDADGFGGASSTVACDPPAGWVADGADCDDTDAAVNPAATELCDPDDADEDCDGTRDAADRTVDRASGLTLYPDLDGDGFGDRSASGQWSCDPIAGQVTDNTDCDDSEGGVFPGAPELCDEDDLDDDCDGLSDDDDPGVDLSTGFAWYADGDGDGYGGFTATPVQACDEPGGGVAWSLSRADCDDADTAISPSAAEICDGADTDEDCDGLADDADPGVDLATGFLWYPDADLDGYGSAVHAGQRACDDPSATGSSWLADATDCNDASAAVSPSAAESCNSVDDDCDGTIDNDEVLVGSASACAGLSCLDILDLRSSAPASGFYYIDPDGNNAATQVYCDMSTDGGGYTFYKVGVSSAYYAANAESYCTALGMQLFVPRSLNHRNAALTVARSASYGGVASDLYLYILGIYPDYAGARCTSTALNSGACALWGPSDGGPYYVSARTNITEPNGDNALGASMYYTWTSSDVSWYNDVAWPGYASLYFMCDVGDKWGNGLRRP